MCSAGDPIEVGAIAEVFMAAAGTSRASQTAQSPLLLLSSKSWFGHAEPAAGMVGIAHALLAQQQCAQLPIMHLRSLNPMVVSMLEVHSTVPTAAGAAAARRRSLHAPCQAGPAAHTGGVRGLARTGVSAFAFQVRLCLSVGVCLSYYLQHSAHSYIHGS